MYAHIVIFIKGLQLNGKKQHHPRTGFVNLSLFCKLVVRMSGQGKLNFKTEFNMYRKVVGHFVVEEILGCK